jgi:hypothetical protein
MPYFSSLTQESLVYNQHGHMYTGSLQDGEETDRNLKW